MPSMFERATRGLVKEIGDKELRPVKDMLNATKIHRFSIVARKKSHLLQFWKQPDIPLDVSLMHILEPSSPVPDAAVESPILFSDTVVNKQQAGGSVNAGAQVSFSREATQCQGSSFECQIVTTPYETWIELQKRKLRDPEPSFLGQCRRAEMNLYVVTEIVELLNSPELKDLSSGNIWGTLCIFLKIFVKGKGHKVREKKLTVPQGSVLAYKRKQLVFKEEGWGEQRLEQAANSGSFQKKKKESLKEVLSDIQHCLLVCSMEKEILSQQWDLVQSILEPKFQCSWTVPFTLNPELLAPLRGYPLTITYGLLAECGLKMELNSPTSAWEPQAKEPLCALYAALCILQQLAES
ncbi:gasdermin-C-like [Rhynchonycteris naso]